MSRMDRFFFMFECVLIIFVTASTCRSIRSISGGKEGEDFTAEVVHGVAGSNVSLKCVGEGTSVSWKKGKHNITSDDVHRFIETLPAGGLVSPQSEPETEENVEITTAPIVEIASTVSILHIRNISLVDAGRYHCIHHSEEDFASAEESIQLIVNSAPVLLSVESSGGAVGASIGISCTFQSHPPPEVLWFKGNSSLQSNERFTITSSNEGNLFLSKLVVDTALLTDNGTYMCLAKNSVGDGVKHGTPHLLVHAVPKISWTIARSLGPEDIQLEWQVIDNEEDIKDIEIWISDDGSEQSAEQWKSLASTARSVVLGDGVVDAVKGGGQTISVWLRVNTLTDLKVVSEPRNVTMLLKVPEYIPKASFRGSTLNSLTVNWMSPSSEEAQYVAFYFLTLTDMRSGATQQVKQPLGTKEHSFTNLNAGTQYNFTITACMGVYEVAARDCGPSSPAISGSTLFDPPASVEEVLVTCSHSDYGGWSVDVSWKPAKGATESGSVDHYKLEFTSMANYVDEEGQRRYEDDRREENVSVNFTSYKFIGASANTNYTVKVYAGIKHMYSKGMTAQCRMPVWLPRQYSLKWWKTSPSLLEDGQDSSKQNEKPKAALLKLPVPSISQRNGTICCYRVAVVKLADGVDISALLPPENLPLLTHELAHESLLTAAYVAEAYTRQVISYFYSDDCTARTRFLFILFSSLIPTLLEIVILLLREGLHAGNKTAQLFRLKENVVRVKFLVFVRQVFLESSGQEKLVNRLEKLGVGRRNS
ncbi:Immunoglobulin I-set [Trinorchestia longiramus]|nr:Immunoglobulin I-set [Trinorchestia longiramus]